MTMQNYLSPGALQPKSGGTGVRNWLSPGAIQPQITSSAGQPVTNYDWANPAVSRSSVALSSQANGQPINLVAPAAQRPIANYDWANPVAVVSRAALNSQQNNTLVSSVIAPKPNCQLSWPNPTLALSAMQASAAQALGTFRPMLIGKDTFYGAPGEVSDYDWPNPIGPPLRQNTQPLGAYLPLLVVPVQVPRRPLIWDNPNRGPVHPVQTQPLGTPSLLTLLPGKDVLPFRQKDWPNPTLALSRAAALDAQKLGFVVIPGLQTRGPFGQTDWPNPIRTSALPALLSQSLGFVAVPAPAVPFAQLAWPNPVSESRRAALEAQPPGRGLLPVGMPFAQLDWPNPRGTAFVASTQPLGKPPALVSPTPFAQYDWPNPIVRGRVIDSTRGRAPIYYPPPGPKPFSQTDWPNPIIVAATQSQFGGCYSVLAVRPLFALYCNILKGEPRVRMLTGAQRIRMLSGGCC